MQRFVVPQFIDVENKVIGPITVRQFLILMGAGLIIALAYRLLYFTSFVVVGVVVLAIASIFAFAKVNGTPFHFFLLNFINTLKKPKLRVWNNRALDPVDKKVPDLKKDDYQPVAKQLYKKSRLAELSLVVDTRGRYQNK
jgi:hypothetical protein